MIFPTLRSIHHRRQYGLATKKDPRTFTAIISSQASKVVPNKSPGRTMVPALLIKTSIGPNSANVSAHDLLYLIRSSYVGMVDESLPA